MPYDKLVENIVLAKSRPASQSYTDYAEEMTDLYRKMGNRHHPDQQYADHPGLTHFWARRNITQPQQKALSFAYTFLGIRIQCAECHKHPFDQWTQDDYREFTKFFVPIRFGVDPSDRQQYQTLIEPAQTRSNKDKTGDVRREYPRLLAEGKTLPFEELFIAQQPQRGPVRAQRPRPHKPDDPKSAVAQAQAVKSPATKKNPPRPNAVAKKATADANRRPIVAQKPQKAKQPQQVARKRPAAPDTTAQIAKLLGAEKVDLTQYDDPRVPLMKWLRSRNNRFFARAFVNRVWATYFNVGIVNPPDDLSLANPPSNAELLNYLADGFVKHDYDMKWLHREIVTSRTYQMSWRPNETNRLDQRNFSHAVVRRLPAEVAFDAIREATSSDATVAQMQKDWRDRAIGVPGSGRRGRGASFYALSVFGRSVRQSNCDCDRSNDASLLQTVFMRNDNEVLAMVGDPRTGWVAQMASELLPKTPQGRPAKAQAKSSDAAPKPAATQAIKAARAPQPLRPEQKARQIARLNERIRQLHNDGKTDLVKRLTAQLEELKRRPAVAAADQRNRAAAAAAAQIAPKQLTSDKKTLLVKTAYLRTLNRYPDDHEQTKALAYLNDSASVVSGLRDLLWALVNTEEFIVNH